MQYIINHAQKPDEQRIAEWEEQIKTLKTRLEQYKEEVWVDETRPIENTLFGPVQTSQALFRKDLNEPKRNELLKSIHNIEDNIRKEKRKAEINGFEAAVKQITEWDPYDQNSVSPFFDPEWMFCLKEKFDVVIGNPPYIQLQNNGGELAKLYEPCGYKTFAKTGDIYCLFYERGYQLLKPNGHLCYITSNKWMRAGYGEKTRDFFAKNTNPQLLIDFAGVKIFESATVDTNILLFAKATNEHKTLCAVTNKQNKDSVKNLSVFAQQNGSGCDFNNSDSWVILSPIEQSIKRKIEAVGTPLKDWDINIYRGVLTGYNEAFIISTEKREEILSNCQSEDERTRTAELIRPILRGRDIKRYGYDWAGLYLIATFPSRHYDIEMYPAVKKHLLSFGIERLEQTGKTHIVNGEKVKARKKTNNKWFETQDSISYWEDFNLPKIVWGEISNGKIIHWEHKLMKKRPRPISKNRSANLNTRDINPETDGHLRVIETWLRPNANRINPKIAVLELSTKAVKCLIGKNQELIRNANVDEFNFQNFIRNANKTETGKGLDSQNDMNMRYFEKNVLPTIRNWKRVMMQENVDVVYTVATAAYRTARNRDEIVAFIKERAGINVRILSKKEESVSTMFAYLFSSRYKQQMLTSEHVIMIDQGGGSTEVSVFQNSDLVSSYSINLGTTALRNILFLDSDRDTPVYEALKRSDQKIKERLVVF